MNPDELKAIWASPENSPSPAGKRAFIDAAHKGIQRERRRARGMLIYIVFMVGATTLFSVWQLFLHGIGAEARFAHLMLFTMWIASIAITRNLLKRTKAEPIDTTTSILATLETLYNRARIRCRELQTLLLLFATFIPLTALAIYQLEASGKMRPHEAASAATLAGTILLSGSAWFLFELLARKGPERKHLGALLNDYRS